MQHTYKTRGTCAKEITLQLEGDILTDVAFTGGCNGNLKALSKLAIGRPAEEVCTLLSGLTCDNRGTSCGDQLTHAIKEALERQNQE